MNNFTTPSIDSQEIIVPNFLPETYPQLICYPSNGNWIFWFYPNEEPYPIPTVIEIVGEAGPVVLTFGELLVLANSESEAVALGIKSAKFLSQDEALNKIMSLAFRELECGR